jgi:hypothetical protein
MRGSFTVTAWVQPESYSDFGTIIAKSANNVTTEDFGFFINQTTGYLKVQISDGTVRTNLTGTTAISTTGLTHVAMVYVPSTRITFYINGSQEAEKTTGLPSAMQNGTDKLCIGAMTTQAHFDGLIDSVNLYNVALSTEELAQLADSSPPDYEAYAINQGMVAAAPASVSTAGSVSIALAGQEIVVTAPASVSSAGSTTIALATPQTLNITAASAVSTAGSVSIALATPQTLNITAPASVSTAGSVSIASAGGTEDLAPDSAYISITGYTDSDCANIDDDPDSPDSGPETWMIAPNETTSCAVRVSFPTPSGNPTTGAGLQTFKVRVRKYNSNTGTPTVRMDLYETGGGTALVTGTEQDITSTTGESFSQTWDATNLATANGSAVECHIVITKAGGSPSVRNTGDIDGVEWVCQYS